MVLLLKKMCLYGILIFIVLEVLVRVFHLYSNEPSWYLADDNTYKWVPGQTGYSVYGNRRQQFSKYRINNSGYNSYREFSPTNTGYEVAILGDSFIEGFHQNYFNSIGKKIENKIDSIEVYEYGHSSFDFADQLYLLYVNKEKFDLVDFTIFELKYANDLRRNEYKVPPRDVVFPLLRYSKLLVYMLDIGMVDPIKQVLRKVDIGQQPYKNEKSILNRDSLYLENFKILISRYGLDKKKTAFLLDSRKTDSTFLAYLKKENINVIDYGISFENAKKKPTTLIYDRHWNNYGRVLVADDIVRFLSKD